MDPSLDKITLKEQYIILKKEKEKLQRKKNYSSLKTISKTYQIVDVSFLSNVFLKYFLKKYNFWGEK